jgi:UDP-N-acetylmuramoyl-tripeptide--D-alanyl-D-alanine ligase
LAAPFKAFKKIHEKKLYIVEADCDRPGEGKFLAGLLRPEAVLLTGISGTHSVNFDSLAAQKKFNTVEKAIAFEFGYFLEHATSLVIVNGDDALVTGELSRTKAKIRKIFQNQLKSYKVFQVGTEFNIDGVIYRFNCLLPEEVFYSVAQTMELIKYLGQEADLSFKNFSLPPGRQSVFGGIKGVTIIDSSYNATLDGMAVILKMFNLYPAAVKWAVLGDMLEQGRQEQKSHEQLAELIAKMKWDKIILMGPRVCKYTYPKLLALVGGESIVKFQLPKDALDYLLKNITGGEAVLFKGARFMEGIIEHLLMDKNDVNKLCRREAVWQKRRKEWGL